MRSVNERNSAKYSLAVIVVIGAIWVCSPSGRVQLQQAAADLQDTQAERNTVGDFKLENIAGGFMTNEDLKGKVAVVDLWATWCNPCLEEIPIYNHLYEAFQGEDVAIVGIAVDSPRRDVPVRIRQLGIKYPILIGDDEAVRAFGRLQGFPTTVVIGKDGKIYKRYIGSVPHKEDRIKQDIQHLLVGDSRLSSAQDHQ